MGSYFFHWHIFFFISWEVPWRMYRIQYWFLRVYQRTRILRTRFPLNKLYEELIFQKYVFSCKKYRIWNFENLTPDLDSPYFVSFDQTLWKTVNFRKYPLFSKKYSIWNFENLRAYSDSSTSITSSSIMCWQSMLTNYQPLKSMFLWPRICTQIRTPRPRLPKVRPSPYHHWSSIVSFQNRCSFDLWPRFCTQIRTPRPRLPKVRWSPYHCSSPIVSFQNRCSFDLCANIHRHTQTNYFFSYDPPYSRGNKN
jgi:hypothetical protein